MSEPEYEFIGTVILEQTTRKKLAFVKDVPLVLPVGSEVKIGGGVATVTAVRFALDTKAHLVLETEWVTAPHGGAK